MWCLLKALKSAALETEVTFIHKAGNQLCELPFPILPHYLYSASMAHSVLSLSSQDGIQLQLTVVVILHAMDTWLLGTKLRLTSLFHMLYLYFTHWFISFG